MENNKSEIILIPELKEVPTKKEITAAVVRFLNLPAIPLIQKYVILKALETVVKEGLKQANRQEVIKSALEISEGVNKFDCLNAEVLIMNEKITTTMKEYSYSENVEKLESKIEEMKFKLKLEEDKLKAMKVHEINSGVAQDITKALTDEEREPEYGIKVTLPKN